MCLGLCLCECSLVSPPFCCRCNESRPWFTSSCLVKSPAYTKFFCPLPVHDVLSSLHLTFQLNVCIVCVCVCSSGERPFCCQLCPYRASQKGNLKTHVQSVHHMPFDNSQYPDTRSLLLSQEEHGALAAKHPPTPQQQQQ